MSISIVKLDQQSVNDFWQLRMALLKELKEINNETDTSKLESATKQYYLSHINKDLISWGIMQDNKLVAIGSLCLFKRIPYEENLNGLEGYILNIYTLPTFRNKRFANYILDEIISYASKVNIKRLWLNSSEQGKKLYAKRGFINKENEMELLL